MNDPVPCRGCQAPILWVLTTNGRRMPLDAKPELRAVLTGTSGGVPAMMMTETYKPHWASCPAAGQFKKAKR